MDELKRHPSVAEKLDFFNHNHLPEPLFSVARANAVLAKEMISTIEDHPQLALGLQKLIEAKDCFVRAKLAQVNKEKGNSSQSEPISSEDND